MFVEERFDHGFMFGIDERSARVAAARDDFER